MASKKPYLPYSYLYQATEKASVLSGYIRKGKRISVAVFLDM